MPGHQFLVTVGIVDSLCVVERESKGLNIAFEKCDKSERVGYHIHAFVEFTLPVLVEEFAGYIHT